MCDPFYVVYNLAGFRGFSRKKNGYYTLAYYRVKALSEPRSKSFCVQIIQFSKDFDTFSMQKRNVSLARNVSRSQCSGKRSGENGNRKTDKRPRRTRQNAPKTRENVESGISIIFKVQAV